MVLLDMTLRLRDDGEDPMRLVRLGRVRDE
jgi:hypothetical protein